MSLTIDSSYVSFTAKNTKQSQLITLVNTRFLDAWRVFPRELDATNNLQNGERKYDVFLGTNGEALFNVFLNLEQFPVTVMEDDFDQNGEQTITGFQTGGANPESRSLNLMPVTEDPQKRVFDMFTIVSTDVATKNLSLFVKRVNQEFTANELSTILVNINARIDFFGYDVVTRYRNGKIIGYDIFALFEPV